MAFETKKFSRVIEDFTCSHCGTKVHGNGYTDHCPNCLWSQHVDKHPGDRSEECHGEMKPIYTEPDRKKGFIIYYKCEKCGAKKRVTAAPDDNRELLEALMVRI
ncbi:MAG: RNHCP domain-containing protein [Candidatus Micrarchaeia archaeon]